MDNEWKVCALDQAKRLVELGVVIDTFWYWYKRPEETEYRLYPRNVIMPKPFDSGVWIPAPGVAELGRVLPGVLKCGKDLFFSEFTKADDGYKCGYSMHEDGCFVCSFDIDGPFETEAQSRAAAVIWLIENKRATWDQEKQMLIAA